MAREHDTDPITLRASLETFMGKFNLLDRQAALVQKQKVAVFFKLNVRDGRFGCLRALLRRYQDVCNDVADTLTVERVHLEAGCEVGAIKAKNEVECFLRSVLLRLKDYVA